MARCFGRMPSPASLLLIRIGLLGLHLQTVSMNLLCFHAKALEQRFPGLLVAAVAAELRAVGMLLAAIDAESHDASSNSGSGPTHFKVLSPWRRLA